MIRQFILILALLFSGSMLFATENILSDSGAAPCSAIKNPNDCKYQKVSDKKEVKEEKNVSEDFNLPILRTKWSSISDSSTWSLKERPGFLRLKSLHPKDSKNILSSSFSKEMDLNSNCDAICHIDLTNLKEGNETGMYFLHRRLNCIEVKIENNIKILQVVINNKVIQGIKIEASNLMLRTVIEASKGWFEYSLDGANFIKLGKEFDLNSRNKPSGNLGLFCFSESDNSGSADIDWLYIKPNSLQTIYYAETFF